MALGTDRTPIDRFFVCNVDAAPSIAPDEWELTIGGDAVEGVVTVGLDQLTALPQHEVESWLECAGNGRRLFELVDGHVPSGAEADTQWTLGAMGMASWRGPRLADVLALAGVRPSARWVSPEGLDIDNVEGEAPRMCLPLDKAVDDDTLLALDASPAQIEQSIRFLAATADRYERVLFGTDEH